MERESINYNLKTLFTFVYITNCLKKDQELITVATQSGGEMWWRAFSRIISGLNSLKLLIDIAKYIKWKKKVDKIWFKLVEGEKYWILLIGEFGKQITLNSIINYELPWKYWNVRLLQFLL